MNSRTEAHGTVEPGQTFAEVGIVTHEGQDFSAGGAYVTDDYVVAYLSDDKLHRPETAGDVTTWDNLRIGQYRVTKRWRTARSWISSHMCQVYVTLDDGRCYTGRSGGAGLIVKARRLAQQRRKS